MNCQICNKKLIKNQKTTCSKTCKHIFVGSLNKGKPSKFKGIKGRFTKEQIKKIGDKQRGIPKSQDFKKKCSERMKGIAFFKGGKQSEKQKEIMRARGGDKHYNWKGGISSNPIHSKLYKYNIKAEDYNIMLDSQNHVCAICELPQIQKRSLCIDHDHRCCNDNKSCGKCIRGLLCNRCNQMLGMAKDDVKILQKSIEYLQK